MTAPLPRIVKCGQGVYNKKTMSLLALDVGNTNISIGLFEESKLLSFSHIATDIAKTEDDYGILLLGLLKHHRQFLPEELEGIIISSVVPPLNFSFERMSEKYFKHDALFVTAENCGVTVRVDYPQEVGADRLVNAAAAHKLYRKNAPKIVVDFGTATTFDVVSHKGEYCGGAIAPGIGISCDALFSRAAKLPRVEFEKPKSSVGKNTVHSMQSGIFYGFLGQVEEILRRLQGELRGKTCVIATGGLAPRIARETRMIHACDPALTLCGLQIIYQRLNSKKR